MALDLILKNLLHSQEFSALHGHKWDAICNIIPGTTPRQCSERYEELAKRAANAVSCDALDASSWQQDTNNDARSDTIESVESYHSLQHQSEEKNKVNKSKKGMSRATSSEPTKRLADQGPTMVIHVCDEAKNLKQDFDCPRDLLIHEMQYFAEYLSTDPNRWEEVDISVHCDVQIFDWLMKYVKRKSVDNSQAPALETTNVISILISSHFLKMDSLVTECIAFCHKKMSTILATPCSMTCINDQLVTRIADLFDHNEADNIRDRKDKFKSKLFSKLIEKLFDNSTVNPNSPESAATLYRCGVCKALLTTNLEKKVPCLRSRLTIDEHGALRYTHVRDVTWDVNDWLLSLWQQTRQWRDVYWRVWGCVNWLQCSVCDAAFACAQLPFCSYHPDAPEFTPPATGLTGRWPCCRAEVLRFDPSYVSQGCQFRDHIVKLPEADVTDVQHRADQLTPQYNVYKDLLAHREVVCPATREATDDSAVELNVFALEESALIGGVVPSEANKDDTSKTEPRLQSLTVERQTSFDDDVWMAESEDEFGDDEEVKVHRSKGRRSRVTVAPQAILLHAPDFGTTTTSKWDSSRSLRWNQDAQREEDGRRMKEIVQYLTRLRLGTEKTHRQKELTGGIYCKLEAQWRAVHSVPVGPVKTASVPPRSKTRTTMLK